MTVAGAGDNWSPERLAAFRERWADFRICTVRGPIGEICGHNAAEGKHPDRHSWDTADRRHLWDVSP